jgi:hypothetical protein
MDHIVPLSRGGPNNVENLIISCKIDNQMRQNLEFSLYKKYRSYLVIYKMLRANNRLEIVGGSYLTQKEMFK